jgi:hypothetical protein
MAVVAAGFRLAEVTGGVAQLLVVRPLRTRMIRRILSAMVATLGLPVVIVALLLTFIVLPVAIAYLALCLLAQYLRFT